MIYIILALVFLTKSFSIVGEVWLESHVSVIAHTSMLLETIKSEIDKSFIDNWSAN